jgi:flavin-dependent dehydrogenase
VKQPVETLVVVGGGTAGWMAAALIKARFGASLSVTVVESDRINTVGVGEATLPVLPELLRVLRIDEQEMLQRCDASLKAGLKFVNWRTAAPDDAYYHLFFGDPADEPFLQLIDRLHESRESGGELWRGLIRRGLLDGRSFMENLTIGAGLIAQNKASKRDGDEPYQSPLGYSYHLDAKLFAEFLRDWSVRRGVRHLKDHVSRVEVGEDGNLRSVVTEKNGVVAGDFFVDCSGFRGLLINETLQEPFDPYARWLLNDRAVAFQVPYGQEEGTLPACTTLDALTAGWLWKIPLFTRVGAGYVYSSAFRTSDEAESEARAHLGPVADGCPANHIKMRIGKNRRTWVNNCLSVGLAAGFLEALESTSIALIQRGVAKFLACFRDRCYDDQDRDRYNRVMTEDFEECRDFLNIHYCLSEREDSPFWQEARRTERPDRVDAVLEEWRELGSLRTFIEGEGVGRFFPAVSWYSILLGMTASPNGPGNETPGTELGSTIEWLARWRTTLAQLVGEFPDHRAYMEGLRVPRESLISSSS